MRKESNLVTAKSRAQELAPGTKVLGYVALNEINSKTPVKVYKRKKNADSAEYIREQNQIANLKAKFNGKV